jgi:hypothetical protein
MSLRLRSTSLARCAKITNTNFSAQQNICFKVGLPGRTALLLSVHIAFNLRISFQRKRIVHCGRLTQ